MQGEPLESTSIITDQPQRLGYLDGSKAVEQGGRVSREAQMPQSQRPDYRRGFRQGAKEASKL